MLFWEIINSIINNWHLKWGIIMKKNKNGFIFKKKNNRKNIYLALLASVAILAVLYDRNIAFTKDNDRIVEGLSDSLIRFHVIANSDLEEDQALKIKVKDAVVNKMQDLLVDSTTVDISRSIIMENMEEIRQLAETVLRENGSTDKVTIALQQQEFPLKQYGDIVLPPGQYEALVIKIGAAQGKNWWCVLFPPLCFVDATHGVVDNQSKESLKKVLTQEEYSAIIMSKDKDVNIKVSSRLFRWFEEKENDFLKNSMFADQF